MEDEISNQSLTSFFSVDQPSQDFQEILTRKETLSKSNNPSHKLTMIKEENETAETSQETLQETSRSSIFGDGSLLEECFYGKKTEKSRDQLEDISMIHVTAKNLDDDRSLVERCIVTEDYVSETYSSLVNMTWYWLDNMMYENAKFASERLVALSPQDPEPKYLKALCYYRSRELISCYQMLKALPENLLNLKSQFLLGRVSLELKDFSGAEKSFRLCLLEALPSINKKSNKALEFRCDGPDRCSILLLLADTLRQNFRKEEAETYYEEAWKINPFSWKAFESLCHISSSPISTDKIQSTYVEFAVNPFLKREDNLKKSKILSESNFDSIDKSQADSIFKETTLTSQRQHDSEKTKRISESAILSGNDYWVLGSEYNPHKKICTGVSSQQNILQVLSKPDKLCTPSKQLSFLYFKIFLGYAHLTQIDARGAMEIFSTLPSSQYNTYWVYCALGRAYYEDNDYSQSKEFFNKAINLEPFNISSLEYYSMLLWQEKDLGSLINLVSRLHNVSPDNYQTMLASGILYSLKGSSIQAIRILEEAVRLFPTFPHASGLLGHEYLSLNKENKATIFFHESIQANPRYYSAWYGLGLIDLTRGFFDKSLYNLKKAVQISPNNRKLLDVYAAVLVKSDRFLPALEIYEKVLKKYPNHLVSRYQRAKIYAVEGKIQFAIAELKALLRQFPNEAALHLTIGKLYAYTNDTINASLEFEWAFNLSPGSCGNIDYLQENIGNLSHEILSDKDFKTILFGNHEKMLSKIYFAS